jgi:hypothetical protein
MNENEHNKVGSLRIVRFETGIARTRIAEATMTCFRKLYRFNSFSVAAQQQQQNNNNNNNNESSETRAYSAGFEPTTRRNLKERVARVASVVRRRTTARAELALTLATAQAVLELVQLDLRHTARILLRHRHTLHHVAALVVHACHISAASEVIFCQKSS